MAIRRNEVFDDTPQRTAVRDMPSSAMRPGDMLNHPELYNFNHTARAMNSIGSLVGCCDVGAPVYLRWQPRHLVQQMHMHGHAAVVYGTREAVIDIFQNVHSMCRIGGLEIRNSRNRSIEFTNDSSIVFAYASDGLIAGYNFNSVWIIGQRAEPRAMDAEIERRDSQEQTTRLQQEVESQRAMLRAIEERRQRIMAGARESASNSTAGVRPHQLHNAAEILRRFQNGLMTSGEAMQELRSTMPEGSVSMVPDQEMSEEAGEKLAKREIKPSEPVSFPEKRIFLVGDDE